MLNKLLAVALTLGVALPSIESHAGRKTAKKDAKMAKSNYKAQKYHTRTQNLQGNQGNQGNMDMNNNY